MSPSRARLIAASAARSWRAPTPLFDSPPSLRWWAEPFRSLAAPTAQHLRDRLLPLWSRRRPTILFVPPDLREALGLAARVLFLPAGPGRAVLALPLDLPRPRSP